MKRELILTVILFLFFSSLSLAQNRIDQLSATRGWGFAMLQDDLWGNQIYKGLIKQTTLNYEWNKKKRQNHLKLSMGNGTIAVPNSIRKNTDVYQFDLNYHHLRKITTLTQAKIDWALGGGISTFVKFRIQNQFASNNLASYDVGGSFQLQNHFYKTLLLKNNKAIYCSFLIETALLTAYLRPDYASSDTEDSFDLGGLDEVTIGAIARRMDIVSIPTFFKINMHTTMDYFLRHNFGLRAQYSWHLLQGNRKLTVTDASHQIHFGLFVRFGKNINP